MTVPIIFDFPVRRPGFIESATWAGPDDDLSLELHYRDTSDQIQTVGLPTTSGGAYGKVCLPSSANITHLTSQTLIAHLRMGTMLTGFVPGTKEWTDSFVNQSDTNNLQTAIGNVKVAALTVVDQQLLDVSLQKVGTNNPTVVIRTDYNELCDYSFAPSTQLLVVPGSIEKQFPTYVHDYPITVLSASQRTDIIDYVLSSKHWV